MQEYAAALQQVLPPDYVATSHHAKWGECFMRALGACDRSLGVGMPSLAGIEVRMCIVMALLACLVALLEGQLYLQVWVSTTINLLSK